MSGLVNALFVNWRSTLVGAAVAAALAFFTNLQAAPGGIWSVVGTVAIAAIGAAWQGNHKAP